MKLFIFSLPRASFFPPNARNAQKPEEREAALAGSWGRQKARHVTSHRLFFPALNRFWRFFFSFFMSFLFWVAEFLLAAAAATPVPVT